MLYRLFIIFKLRKAFVMYITVRFFYFWGLCRFLRLMCRFFRPSLPFTDNTLQMLKVLCGYFNGIFFTLCFFFSSIELSIMVAPGADCDGAFLSATPELFAVFLLTSLSLPISASISSILNLSLNRNSTPLTVAYHIVFPSIKTTINFTTFPCLLQCAIATKKKLQKVLRYTDYVPARLYSGSLFFQPYHCFTGYKSEQNRFQCIKESDGHKSEPFKALCPYFEFVTPHRKRNTPC